MTGKDQNIDDYYSQIQVESGSDTDSKKPVLKLKIKAKKIEEEVVSKEVETVIIEDKKEEKQFKAKTPTNVISFEPRKEIKPEEKKVFHSNFQKPRPEFNRPTGDRPFFKRPENQENKQTKSGETNKNKPDFQTPLSSPKFTPQKKEFGFNKKPGGGKPFGSQDDYLSRKFGQKRGLKTRGFVEDDGSFRRSKKSKEGKKEKNVEEIKQILVDRTGQNIPIGDFLTVKEFSDKIGVPISKLIQEFLKNGMMVNLNSKIDFDTCFIIAETFGIKVIKDKDQEVSMASILKGNISDLTKNEDTDKLKERPPIISIMGHVDHGKTSILDYIRKTAVASDEAGGITQKIGAYQIEKEGKKITFLDTPGHEAFSIMRARGAKLTDIAIIVVAGDEGIKPQTIESINHAKEAGVPIIVAVNKMDKAGANLDLVKGQLAENGLQPEDWGGNTVVVPVSAHTGLGIDTLLDMIILTTEIQELKANPDRSAIGTIIESHLDAKLGPLATVLVNAGTLNKGDFITCAGAFGRVKFLKDFKGKNIEAAGPSTPVLLSGLSSVVEGGDILQVTQDALTARQKTSEYNIAKSSKSINKFEQASLEMLLNRIKTGNLKQLKIVLKADSNGSLEAMKEALFKLNTAETQIQLIHSGVGDINDSDVLMAGTSQAILVGFNVGYVGQAKNILANSKIEVINKKVIYHILEKIELIITGMIDIKHDDLELGEAKVKQIFYTGKDKLVLGLEVLTGKIENRAKLRIIRDGKKIGNGEVASLKSGVMDTNEVLAGEDCGIAFKGDLKVEVGDTLEIFKVVQRK
ncbi:translation initiation factor IF-2 [Candidatus Gracilibacteria bacterium]|nr:translation initiation factor IF-2 [Candidatus Gracilibacteria bacterium]